MQTIRNNPPRRKFSGRVAPARRSFLLIPLACFALLPMAFAVSPAPDGGYANGNTAEGTNALFSLTTGVNNTATGFDALFRNTIGNSNTATGFEALARNTTASGNTATGFGALFKNTTANSNTATGADALFNNTTGSANAATGNFALDSNTTGSENTANGFAALFSNTTGKLNIALGETAGQNLTTGSNNIDVGNPGALAAESNIIRIGTVVAFTDKAGVMHPAHSETFIAGIHGVAVTGSTVVVNSTGQLGSAPSSARFKEAIKPMDNASEAILALKPVTFHYKKDLDPDGIPQFGLVAEQVEKVNPDLVARDDQGKVNTVRYEAVNAMLLNEFLKEHRKVEEQKAGLAEVKSTVAKQNAIIAQQQKQIEALNAGLQKVSAQVELSRPAPQIVVDNQ
jgi:hypothetical protein